MHFDPFIIKLVAVSFGIFFVGLIFRSLKLPYLIGYILVGTLLGKEFLGIVDDKELLKTISEMGVVLLLFFIGMEVQPKNLIANWKVALIGIIVQVGASVAISLGAGSVFGWDYSRSILLGFIISLSSTAVLLRLLKDWGELNSKTGQSVLAILLTQDLAIIPMMIAASFLGQGPPPSAIVITKQVIGAIVLIGLVVYATTAKKITLPFAKGIQGDYELQVFAAMGLCFGFALLTGVLDMSAALGGFVAGIIVGAAKETAWVHRSLEPFRVMFVALFFAAIGMTVNLRFLMTNLSVILLFSGVILVVNTLINTLVLRANQGGWRESIYFGILMSQIGEFSFILAAVGLETGIVTEYVYQMTIAIITITLFVSPVLIQLSKKLLNIPFAESSPEVATQSLNH